MNCKLLIVTILLFISATLVVAQTGKITGHVLDAATGEDLPGANIVIEGTELGAATDVNGIYTIINVPPGTFTLKASFIGYTGVTTQNVRVNINLTTTIDFNLSQEAIAGEEVVVTAEAPVVQPDISANVANINIEEIVNIPVAGVSEFIDLQAGIEPGLTVRGSDPNEIAFIVDGISMRDARNNQSVTNISLTAVEEMQIQTGGFNAEYGNVRSGLFNVVTKTPSKSRYSGAILFRYIPAQEKHFGPLPGLSNPNAYWIYPYITPGVREVGTQEGLDPWAQNQYPLFEGWNKISETLMGDDNPDNDLTPEQLVEVFKWRHRKDMKVTIPDYVGDVSFSGPVPLVSEKLGNLRFLASYRQTQTAYIIPQQRDKHQDFTTQLKVISDLSPNMRLAFRGLYTIEQGMLATESFGNGSIDRGQMPSYPWQDVGMVSRIDGAQRDDLFGWHLFNPTDITRNMFAVDFTHTLSPKTYYKVSLERMFSKYYTRHGAPRDEETIVKTVGNYGLTEAPWGWTWDAYNDYSGMRLAGHWGKPEDSTKVQTYRLKLDMESQINRYANLKGGFEFNYNDYDVIALRVDRLHTIQSYEYRWERFPIQAAAYIQNKLEFQGMIANLGLRMDVFDPNGKWHDHDYYERAFDARVGFDQLAYAIDQKELSPKFYFSPRAGISFPITVNSKLFFNYGHFRQMPNPMDIFSVRSRYLGNVDEIGNPEIPLPRTIAYELGYEHNINDIFLLRATGYYKNVSEQPRNVGFHSLDGIIDYTKDFPYNYSDTRGFELTLEKKARKGWYRGFINYTYMVRNGGNFGLGEHYENMAEQREYLRTTSVSQWSSIPEPFGRFNIEFFTPKDLGPKLGGFSLLGDWVLNFLGEYRGGQVFKYTYGVSMPDLDENMHWKDYYNLDLRLTKYVDTPIGNMQFYLDFKNVLNLKFMHRFAGFEGDFDTQLYYASLHLPEDSFGDYPAPYEFIPGEDRPGDYRKDGVKFQPIEIVKSVGDVGDPHTRPLYYEKNTKKYMQWNGSEWKKADQGFVDQVLEDKAYIDMPNEPAHSFLNPRRILVGIRLNF